MISSLVRWLGRGTARGRSGRGARPARRFTPQLEALEGRAAPSGVIGTDGAQAAQLGANDGGPAHVIMSGFAITGTRKAGDEIPA